MKSLSLLGLLSVVVFPSCNGVPLLGDVLGSLPVLNPILNGAVPGLPNLKPVLSNNTFDFIVVGAGTAGLALASRLAEDGSSVAVVEAGFDVAASLLNQELSSTPGGDTVGVGSSDSDFLNDGIDWGFRTAPQAGANERVIRYARGKGSGGSSARNFMIYQRPSVGSMISWQRLTGDSSWGFNERKADFKKSMTFTPPRPELRRENPAAQFDPADFGSSSNVAPLSISYPNTPQNFSKFMQLSANELGVKTVRSFNGGSLLGVQYNSATIKAIGGRRSTSRDFYAISSSKPNYTAYFQTLAKKILFQKGTDGRPKAVGVALSTLPGGKLAADVIYAKKEIIITAGAFQSPQLLMVSGIGPKAQLQKYDIEKIAINENVGQGMQDHIFFGPSYKVDPATRTFTDLAADPIYLATQLVNFTVNQLGPLTNHVADLLAWERPNDRTLASIGASQLSSYPADWPILEALSAPGVVGDFSNLLTQNAEAGKDGSRFATILFALVAPQSRGSITLASADTSDAPIIDPGWLTDPVDQRVAIYAFKRARQYFATKAMRPVLVDEDEFFPGPAVQTDAQILDWIRNNLMTVWHASCTCSMRSRDQGGVLDSRLRVYDVTGLRVVDAASFPDLAPGHPQSVIYMLAERAATLIKQDNA